MAWLGGCIVLIAFYAIVRRYETRLVLFLAGMLMAALAGKPAEATKAFSAAMVHTELVPIICTVMGFSFVMKWTKCDDHLIKCLTSTLQKFQLFLIPGAILVTFMVGIALPSAAGTAAAVGAILIPALISVGVHPAIAASAIMAGTWGGSLSPGSAHNAFIAKIAGTDIMTVIGIHAKFAAIALTISAISLLMLSYRKKTDAVLSQEIAAASVDATDFKVSYSKAVMPLIPLALLILASNQVHVLPPISVPQAMLAGIFLAFLATRANLQDICKTFFKGMGEAYANVISIIVTAMVFTKGMEVIGLTAALVEVMKGSEYIARIACSFGPFIMAVITGSGDATVMAFNSTITPHAEQFGFTVIDMGTQAHMAGIWGRTLSPVAGAAIVCSQLAGVGPIEIAKYNWLGMLIATIVCMFVFM